MFLCGVGKFMFYNSAKAFSGSGELASKTLVLATVCPLTLVCINVTRTVSERYGDMFNNSAQVLLKLLGLRFCTLCKTAGVLPPSTKLLKFCLRLSI